MVGKKVTISTYFQYGVGGLLKTERVLDVAVIAEYLSFRSTWYMATKPDSSEVIHFKPEDVRNIHPIPYGRPSPDM